MVMDLVVVRARQLGLALTRRLVMAQSGSVGVRSVLGVGSVFHIVLNRTHGTDAAKCAHADDRLAMSIDHRLLMIHDHRDGAPELVLGIT